MASHLWRYGNWRILRMSENEDQIIADGLLLIRHGVYEANWQEVLNGYNMITAEGLELPEIKKKSRLENIREKMGTAPKVLEDVPMAKPSKEDVSAEGGEINISDTEIRTTTIERKPEGKGGKRFGTDSVGIISTGVDLKEKEKNERINKLTMKDRRPPHNKVELRKTSETGGIRFDPNPDRPSESK
jgi:hypothetical protein